MLVPHPTQAHAWVADPDVPRDAHRPAQALEVAVGILLQPDGQFLLTTRPPGKVYAGYWEFPGGKLEAGEGLVQALARELDEELGIHIQQAEPWLTVQVDYPHAQVNLRTCRIEAWTGALTMREGQQFCWCQWPLAVAPILPGAWPMLHALAKAQAWSGALTATS